MRRAPPQGFSWLGSTPHGDKVAKTIRNILSGHSKPTPIEHWERVLSTPDLPDIAYEYARTALTRLQRSTRARVPGEDDA